MYTTLSPGDKVTFSPEVETVEGPQVPYILTLALSGILLANSHLVTGVDVQVDHWRILWGPATELLFLVAVGDVLQRHMPRRPAIPMHRWSGFTCGTFFSRRSCHFRNRFKAGSRAAGPAPSGSYAKTVRWSGTLFPIDQSRHARILD